MTAILCKHGHLAERKRGRCVECTRLSAAAYHLRKGEARRAANRDWFANNKDKRSEWNAKNAEKIAAIQRRHFDKNRTQRIAQLERWRAANPDKLKAATERWVAANPETIRVHARNRRARLRKTGGTHTAEDIAHIAKLQRHRCAYCRVKLSHVKVHVDHIEPVALGGTNDRSNLQLLCQPCNGAKYCKPPLTFARERGLLL